MDSISFLKRLYKKLWLLIPVPVLSATMAFYLVYNSPKSYYAEAEMSTGITDHSGVKINDEENIQPFIINNKFSNLIEKMKSKTVINTVIYDILIHELSDSIPFKKNEDDYFIDESAKKNLVELVIAKKKSATGLNPSVADELKLINYINSHYFSYKDIVKSLKIDRINDSDYLRIAFESDNPEYSAFVVNTVCENFINYHENKMLHYNQQSVDFFATLAEKKRQELFKKLNEMKDFKLKNKIINLYEQTKAVVNQIKDLEVIKEQENKKIPSLAAALTDLNSRFDAKDKFYKEKTLIDSHTQLKRIKNTINQLNQEYIRSGFKNELLKDSIEKEKKSIELLIAKTSDIDFASPVPVRQELLRKKLEFELELAISKETVKSLDIEIARLNQIVADFAPMEAGISGFEREISVASEVYLLILNKLNSAQFAAIDQKDNLKIENYATVPQTPAKSGLMLITLLAGIVSFIITFVVVFLLEYFDENIRTTDGFVEKSGMALIGFLNYITKKDASMYDIITNKCEDVDCKIYSGLIRKMRYELLKSPLNNKILFTSSKEKQGKSAIILSLLHGYALLGKNILLLNLNPKNNDLANLTQIANIGNLSDYLFGKQLPPSLPLHKGAVSLITVDENVSSALELASDELILKDTIRQLGSQYDIVLAETGALFTSPDLHEWFNSFDTVIPVFCANRVLEKAELKWIKDLKTKYFNVPGAMLNGLTIEFIENEIGEIDKKRTGIRKFVKRVLKRSFDAGVNFGKLKFVM